MRIVFNNPKVGPDVTRIGVTVDQVVIYPPDQNGNGSIVINAKSGTNISLDINALSATTKTRFATFVTSLIEDARAAYEAAP